MSATSTVGGTAVPGRMLRPMPLLFTQVVTVTHVLGALACAVALMVHVLNPIYVSSH